MLEGINSDPIEGLLPKRSLCASIQTILLEYPDDTRLESHITYAINDALTKHRPNALKSQLSRATYARYALRAALGQADEGAMVCRIKEGTERGLVPVVGNGSAPCLVEPPGMRSLDGDDKSAISQATDEEGETCDIGAQSSLPDAGEDELDSEDLPDYPACEDRHSLRSDIPQGGPLTNLRRLAIGSPCARTMSRRPDNFTFDTLDCIVPTQMCCWLHLDDTLPHNGDEGLLPYASIMIRDTFTPKSKGPCSIAA